jgi:CrcB protein
MIDWPIWLAIGSGGAVGALLRGLIFDGLEKISFADADGFWAAQPSARATLIVNLLGSLVLGVLVGGTAGSMVESSEATRIFWTTGVCGALTTFGTLCADVVGFARTDQRIRGAGILAAHLFVGIAAFLLGRVAAS